MAAGRRAGRDPSLALALGRPGNRLRELLGDQCPAVRVLISQARRQQRVLDGQHRRVGTIGLDRHRHDADAVRRFEAVYQPELASGPVTFTNYVQIATSNRG